MPNLKNSNETFSVIFKKMCCHKKVKNIEKSGFVFQTDANINDLLNTLECPVCLDTADSPPIYQCPEGHLLCQRCNQRLVDCPQCGHALMNSRNRIAEDLAIKLQVRDFLSIFQF